MTTGFEAFDLAVFPCTRGPCARQPRRDARAAREQRRQVRAARSGEQRGSCSRGSAAVRRRSEAEEVQKKEGIQKEITIYV